MSLLDSASDIACYGELFKAERVELPRKLQAAVGVETVEQRNADPAGFLHRLAALTPDKIFGFKIFMPSHLRWAPTLATELDTAGWNTVILCREPVQTYASLLRAKATKVWTHRPNEKKNGPSAAILNQKVSFSSDSITSFADNYNRFLIGARARARGERCFVLHYDQLGEPAVMGPLLSFVGSNANPASLTSSYARQFSRPLPEGFANWNELCAFLATHSPFVAPPPPTVGGGEAALSISATRG
jgi:hypothetical protein